MNVLIDTSVWVDHFRNRNQTLFELLALDAVLTHPMVLGELACGTPPAPRLRTLNDLGLLQECKQASMPEVMAFVEREKLYGMGCGLVDLTLLASTLITPGARFWTLDRRLAALADRFSVEFRSTAK
ncbi:MAG: VapC toxin family PIN domain ribonuclease [Burkholderia sp.]|jgi:predicted nucleic acid-binding protein|uniref:type II toxin-antitoxin system VapC family toxin n=1 Tax=Burkholderia sp. TaxID=36773 RepID=UPI00283701AA|nr:PIN domain-containing protein [Burkholderia sp.]MDR0240993.1 VapC toxin family PIN domain ribonuclease [Burkholderia sp.]